MRYLRAILRPPVEAIQVGDWSVAEARLGTSFPGDYRVFVDTYGTGQIDDFLAIYTPFARRKGSNIFEQLAVEQERFDYITKAGNEDLPYELWPSQGGLIPVGGDDNGNVIFWRAEGTPDTWGIVVIPARSDKYEEFSTTVVDFLTGVLTRELVVQCYPSDFPSEQPIAFVPCD